MECSRNSFCNCLYYSANALARNITRLAEKAFSPVGLAPSHAFILMTVNSRPGITAGELASVMQLQPSTVSRLVEKLEEQKYLHRAHDGKYVAIFPLKKSQEKQEALKTAWFRLYQDYIALLGEEEAKKLTGEIYTASQKLENLQGISDK